MTTVPDFLLILSAICAGFWASYIRQTSILPFTLTPELKNKDILVLVLFVSTFFTIAGLAGGQPLQVAIPFFIGWCVKVMWQWKATNTKNTFKAAFKGAAHDTAILLVAFISVVFVSLSEGILLLSYMPSFLMPFAILAPLSLYGITLFVIRWRYKKM